MIDISQRSAPARTYLTRGGLRITCVVEPLEDGWVEALAQRVDTERGAIFSSGIEIPGRYTRWDLGFSSPPIAIEARGRSLTVSAENPRGTVVLPALRAAAERSESLERIDAPRADAFTCRIRGIGSGFSEEERGRQPSVFGLLRSLASPFESFEDAHLGLYGAFGYDLAFQLEPIPLQHTRSREQRDLVLYLPDELFIADRHTGHATRRRYEFECGGSSTADLPRRPGSALERSPSAVPDCRPGAASEGDHAPGEYAGLVRRAKAAFMRGDLLEVVPSQVFRQAAHDPPSVVFARLCERNPAPYGFVLNLGRGEHLVGASPEMYVRVSARSARGDPQRVETCPIAGTIGRGRDALGDARQVLRLLQSQKDESELTMCTDVDRNDKSRVCRPGSVRVLARREIERYSRLIHTVDHVEGELRRDCDAIDAFLAHAWAVTVTGAPKRAAMEFIERSERSPRRWYGGAVGALGFDGHLNTGLVLRTIRLENGQAEVRAGATLLHASDPEAEEAETRLKAEALLDALCRPSVEPRTSRAPVGRGALDRDVLLVDCQDSFVHTLAAYLRQTGARVTTLRVGFDLALFERRLPQLVVLSPGPGRPDDFPLRALLDAALAKELPVFGVCLGLQAIALHCGGALATLPEPAHGRSSRIRVRGGSLLRALPREFDGGRYHSLHVCRRTLPDALEVTAESDDGVVMAVEHRNRRVAGVQFHPESLLTQEDDCGLRLLESVVEQMTRPK